VSKRRGGDRWARAIGLVLGVAFVGTAITLARVHGGSDRVLGADVTFASGPTGELAVSPIGPFVRGLNLRPTSPANASTGSIDVRNQTGSTLRVRVDASPSIRDLDGVLFVRITAGDRRLFRGPLGKLRHWTSKSLTLVGGGDVHLEIATWVPPAMTGGYEGRIADVGLQFQSSVAGA
jgi:hypothetical protein